MQDYISLGFKSDNIIAHPHNSSAFFLNDLLSIHTLVQNYGVEITGAPIGCDEFVAFWLQKKLEEFRDQVFNC